MNYFTSGIYGNKALYERIKKILTRPSDTLWILGDIFDGNDEKPWECLEILEDIENSPNIHLILGDHEYFHAMRILSMDNPESTEAWIDQLNDLEISAKPLLDYMETLSEDDLLNYAFFLSKCEVSEMIKIGDNYFYLCHGAPSIRLKSPGGDMAWQYDVVTNSCNIQTMYQTEITNDIRISEYEKQFQGIDLSRCHLIVGHDTIQDFIKKGEITIHGLIHKNKKFYINPGFTTEQQNSESWKILGIDAAGFFIQEID